MSDYLLDYVGNVVLRQAVQGSLAGWKPIINGRYFRGSTEMEIAVKRLLR